MAYFFISLCFRLGLPKFELLTPGMAGLIGLISLDFILVFYILNSFNDFNLLVFHFILFKSKGRYSWPKKAVTGIFMITARMGLFNFLNGFFLHLIAVEKI